ncbi:MAG: hypothetical protein M3Z04_02080 [Chloroflexota bacterium]|nr:hypothetical protein [Chloroflexota bacterium]
MSIPHKRKNRLTKLPKQNPIHYREGVHQPESYCSTRNRNDFVGKVLQGKPQTVAAGQCIGKESKFVGGAVASLSKYLKALWKVLNLLVGGLAFLARLAMILQNYQFIKNLIHAVVLVSVLFMTKG